MSAGGGSGGDGEEGGSSTSSGLWLLQRKRGGTELSPVLVHRAACLERAEAAPALRHSHRSDSGMDEGEINSSRHLQLNLEAWKRRRRKERERGLIREEGKADQREVRGGGGVWRRGGRRLGDGGGLRVNGGIGGGLKVEAGLPPSVGARSPKELKIRSDHHSRNI